MRVFLDPIAREKFRQLVSEYQLRSVVETGTYHAEGTIEFARYVDTVYSVEIDRDAYLMAKGNLIKAGFLVWYETDKSSHHKKEDKNIYIYNDDSPTWIKANIDKLGQPVCFFLDAHWAKYWPILDEIKAITLPNSVIIIHDFQVPDKDFGYDTYDGQALNYDFVKDALALVNPDFEIKYNEESEAVDKRGILYALPRRRK